MLQIDSIRRRFAFIFGYRTEQNYIFVALDESCTGLLANDGSGVRGAKAIAGAAVLGAAGR